VIHVAFTAERGYVRHAAAMLDSLLQHHAPEQLKLSVLQGPDHATDESVELERWLAARGCALQRLTIAEQQLEGFRSTYFHRSIWYRILLPELLPEAARVLYLDADVLVTAPLDELWNVALADNLFAGVTNPLYPFMGNWPVSKLGLPSERLYPNSGVLLMDLAAMRHAHFVEGVRRYARAHIHGGCAEQDALAAAYHPQCLFVHPRWNAQTPLYDLPAQVLPWTDQEIREAREHPAIVHFTGPAKPSHYLCRHPYRDAYVRHRAATPWPLRGIQGRNPLNFVLRRAPLIWEVRYARIRSAVLRRLGQDRPIMQRPDQH
jgi:lipopolysaccharide biosynthesis glycosyltransferase